MCVNEGRSQTKIRIFSSFLILLPFHLLWVGSNIGVSVLLSSFR